MLLIENMLHRIGVSFFLGPGGGGGGTRKWGEGWRLNHFFLFVLVGIMKEKIIMQLSDLVHNLVSH